MNLDKNLTIFLRDLPDDTSYTKLKAAIEVIGSVSKLELINVQYKNEIYFLRSAYFLFSSFNMNQTFVTKKQKIQYKNFSFEGDFISESLYYLRALIVVNLNKNVTEYDIKSQFVQFRPKEVYLILSSSGQTQCAIVEFKQVRDRDSAFLRCEKQRGTTFYLFPSDDQVEKKLKIPELSYNPRPLLPTVILPTDFVFIHNNNQYICHEKNVKDICKRKFKENKIRILDIDGDFSEIQRYIDGAEIEVNETNVTFLYRVGNFLEIRPLSDLNISKFITMNNIIIMANEMQYLNNISSLSNFINKNLAKLTQMQRLRLLPITVITQCFESPFQTSIKIDPCQLLLQIPKDTENQTPLASLIQYKTLDIPEFRVVLQTENIDLNRIANFLPDYCRVIDSPPYITCDIHGDPFDGIFAYLTRTVKMNPHNAGIVRLEASSTQVSTVSHILDYGSNDYFATRDVPNQWIKFTFQTCLVSLNGYTMKTHSINGNGHTKSWKVTGSNNGTNWTLIHEMTNTTVLSSYGAIYTAQLPHHTPFYREIMFTQTGTNTMNYHNFRVANIEFFGKIQYSISSG